MLNARRRGQLSAAAAIGALVVAAASTAGAGAQPAESIARDGKLPLRWTAETPDCANARPFLVHAYNPAFIILRQSGCTNFEKPFLYLLLGSKEALLVDTGAPGADASAAVDDLLRGYAQRQHSAVLPLVAVHSHGHSDHTAGDRELTRRGARVVEATPKALQEFFHIKDWPHDVGRYDLGERRLEIIPIPGHQGASIAIYDERTQLLLTGDTLYPGRLFVRDAAAFTESIDRLVAFTASHDVSHVFGAHIENTRTPYLDYPEGTAFQPDEHALELGRAHLLELQDALRGMGQQLQRRRFRDFTIWPVAPAPPG
jgi:glyoxylase-like metal-dependent hydrolase (beta-lactamase superfamily II)